jgi:hypothetical protein
MTCTASNCQLRLLSGCLAVAQYPAAEPAAVNFSAVDDQYDLERDANGTVRAQFDVLTNDTAPQPGNSWVWCGNTDDRQGSPFS